MLAATSCITAKLQRLDGGLKLNFKKLVPSGARALQVLGTAVVEYGIPYGRRKPAAAARYGGTHRAVALCGRVNTKGVCTAEVLPHGSVLVQ